MVQYPYIILFQLASRISRGFHFSSNSAIIYLEVIPQGQSPSAHQKGEL